MTDRRNVQINIARIPVSGGFGALLAILVLLGALAIELPAVRSLALWAMAAGTIVGVALIALRRGRAGRSYDEAGWQRARTVQRLLAIGVTCIFLGEAFCLLGLPAVALTEAGPARYDRLIDVVCHSVLYLGIVLTALGTALYLRDRLTGPARKPQ